MNHYISNHEYVTDAVFDTQQIAFEEEHKQLLMKDTDMDGRLAEHIAKMFWRDPLQVL